MSRESYQCCQQCFEVLFALLVGLVGPGMSHLGHLVGTGSCRAVCGYVSLVGSEPRYRLGGAAGVISVLSAVLRGLICATGGTRWTWDGSSGSLGRYWFI